MSSRKPTVDLGYPTDALGKLPSFASVEDEAAFWDTHDVTDFLDGAMPLDLAVADEVGERVSVRLGKRDRDTLLRLAGRAGVAPATLARRWLEERLRREEQTDAAVG